MLLSPPAASLLRRPGQPALPPGVERHRVPAGGSVTLRLAAGEALELVDIEGGQVCELSFVTRDGRFRTGALGLAGDGPAGALQALLAAADGSGRRLAAALLRAGADPAQGRALRLFGPDSRAGDRVRMTAAEPGLLIAVAPRPPAAPDSAETATPLHLFVTRAPGRRAYADRLPDPLAEPLTDLRIRPASARAFTVRAGEWIQVIDVDGRQCSDFQCFDARKLDRGIEHALDATITRTLTGRSYPAPGLPSKAFDRDFQPLVEIVQDTVGRHDAFATACNARYYEDQGYPGHPNCSDNFNAALNPFGVAARKGWEALNFFYNTGVDHLNQLYFDEPWSRPGDYVLMRALTDLVCVSSSCPDDIDPANGWDLTDIHIRTYSGRETFQRAVAWRMTPDAEPELTRETGFHAALAPHVTEHVEYRGFWLPQETRAGRIAEYRACREAAAVIDLSALRKYEVTGPDAGALLQWCLTRDVSKLSVGQVVYSAMCYDHGGMVDDGTLFRMGEMAWRWIGGDDASGLWLREQAGRMGYRAWVRSSTDRLHNIAVQGPASREILRDLVWTAPNRVPLADLDWFRFTVGRIGGFEGIPVVVSRTGYTGELGYEVFCDPKDAGRVLEAVMAAGAPHGLIPMGLAALDMLRIEAGLVFAGHEFTDRTDPFEAGLGFAVALKGKADDFCGRAAIEPRKAHPRQVLAGLALQGRDAVAHGDGVFLGRAQVGVVTSATHSPVLGRQIALARLEPVHAAQGTRLEVGRLDGQMKRIPAEVTGLAQYDPQKLRPRGLA
ncbi:DUF1989 domain-containing protein [Frigidibacter oleivorans]|uniref:DUF1989 domain-containing protein n=1 Tax=Frigidibacter oleivorans TaxID=2487129 RepID=UPI000F8EE21F|nr:aminomethyltransferase family protein [Frigidibacter oleivorans]